jgi:hypothetical protein
MKTRPLAMRVAMSALAIILSFLVAPQSQSQGVRVINCRALSGAGSFSSPKFIGELRGTTVVRNCRGLSSGRGFNRRYYLFSTSQQQPQGAAIGTAFILREGAISAVHPRLALPNGQTLLRSRNGFWSNIPPFTRRFLPIEGLFAGTYIFGVEKLDSPLRSLQTPRFHIIFFGL